jgi:hypothetical protein
VPGLWAGRSSYELGVRDELGGVGLAGPGLWKCGRVGWDGMGWDGMGGRWEEWVAAAS